MSTNNSINLWILNRRIEIGAGGPLTAKKVCNIATSLYVLTTDNTLLKGVILDDNRIEYFTQLESVKPIDIGSHQDTLYIVNEDGELLECDENCTLSNPLRLVEETKCSHGHEVPDHLSKIKSVSINAFGKLFITDQNQLWGSGCMPEIGVNSKVPVKIHFFSGRVVYGVAVGVDFAIAIISKHKVDEVSEEEGCRVCELQPSRSSSSSPPLHSSHEDGQELVKNIIVRNTEAAKEFLTRQISRMSSAGEEYLMECTLKKITCTEEPTRIIKENVTSVAALVYEGVATLSRHVSSASSDYLSPVHTRHNSAEYLLQSVSQSTSERDLFDLTDTVQEKASSLVEIGRNLLEREVWMWGNVRNARLDSECKEERPVILSALSNLGVVKVSMQDRHACAFTLDGRAFLWGDNSDHQVTFDNKSAQATPKAFTPNRNERVADVACGHAFSAILSSKSNLTYFGRTAHTYQTIHHKFAADGDTRRSVPSFGNLLSTDAYLVLNCAGKCDEAFENYVVKEQAALEEMTRVNQRVIKPLLKTEPNKLEGVCKTYRDLMFFTALNVESLIECRNCIIASQEVAAVKYFPEFVAIYKNFIQEVHNVQSVNGLSTTSEDLAASVHVVIKHLSGYGDFYRKYSETDTQARWREFIDWTDTHAKEAERTALFWQANDTTSKTLKSLMEPHRRLVCDSQVVPIGLYNSSRFSTHRFVLFSDVLVHLNGSALEAYSLKMLWLEIPQLSSLEETPQICVKSPEETLILAAQDGEAKTFWFHALQQAVKAALDKSHLLQPPAARTGTYRFKAKAGFLKSAVYTGRWQNGKMHGTGKLSWADGRVFQGHFSHNSLSGFGTMTIPDVGSYDGEWKDNRQDGYGTFTYANKDMYRGYFKDGLFHGHGLLRKGSFMANSASLYIGDWTSGKQCGYGVMDEISTGQKYLGLWSDSRKEGSGIIVTADGSYCEGHFRNDTLCGQGTLVCEDGTRYEGEFKSTGIMGGKGAVTLRSGHVIEGSLSGSVEDGVKIATAVLRKPISPQASHVFTGVMSCVKWQALFTRCHHVLGLNDSNTPASKVWQNVAVYLAKRCKTEAGGLKNLDLIPPYGQEVVTDESYVEVKAYLNLAFESAVHPLGSLLNDVCEAFIASYSGKVHSILVDHAIIEIIDVTKRIYHIVGCLFPALRDVEGGSCSESSVEVVSYQSLIYPVILPKVYNCLFTLLSLKNEHQEKQYKKVLIEWNKLSDRNLMILLSVEKKFFKLPDNDGTFAEASDALQQIIGAFLPTEKLAVIKSSLQTMTPVAQKLLGDAYVWNMDDLFPLFLYVVVRSRIPHLGAELEFIEHFMDPYLENGELGIMFTTLKACYQQILQDVSFPYQ